MVSPLRSVSLPVPRYRPSLRTSLLTVAKDSLGNIIGNSAVIRGSAPAGGNIVLSDGGVQVGKAVADSRGMWEIALSQLSAGTHSLTAYSVNGGWRSRDSTPLQFKVDPAIEQNVNFTIGSLKNVSSVSPLSAASLEKALAEVGARFSTVIDDTITIPLQVSLLEDVAARFAASAGAVSTASVDSAGVTGVPKIGPAVLNIYDVLGTQIANPSSVVSQPVVATLSHEMLHVLGFIPSGVLKNYLKSDQGGYSYTGKFASAISSAPIKSPDGAHMADYSSLMGQSNAYDTLRYAVNNPFAPFSKVDLAMLKDFGFRIKPTLVSDDGHTFIPGTQAGIVTGTSTIDRAMYSGNLADYALSVSAGSARVSYSLNGGTHTDTLDMIERLVFNDKTVAVDIDGHAGQAYRMYQAAFDRKPDPGGLGFWIDALDRGANLRKMAHEFITGEEFRLKFGDNLTVEQFVTNLYHSVLHRDPDKGGYEWWVSAIKSSADPDVLSAVLLNFSEGQENYAQVLGSIQGGIEYKVWVG